MATTILFGFDVDRPYGNYGQSDKGKQEREEEFRLINDLNSLFDAHSIGRTYFILGDSLDQAIKQFGKEYVIDTFTPHNPLVEIGQHTYNHKILVPISTRPDIVPVSKEEIRQELKQANDTIEAHLGIIPDGLRTPVGYSKDLLYMPDIVDILKDSGLRYVSSNLRSKDYAINAPLIEQGKARQPYTYHNGLVEIPSHGWQDTAFSGSKTLGIECLPADKEGIISYYDSLISDAEALSRKDGSDISLGLCLHPSSLIVYDKDLEIMRRLVGMMEKKGIQGECYNNALKRP